MFTYNIIAAVNTQLRAGPISGFEAGSWFRHLIAIPLPYEVRMWASKVEEKEGLLQQLEKTRKSVMEIETQMLRLATHFEHAALTSDTAESVMATWTSCMVLNSEPTPVQFVITPSKANS